MNDLQVRHVRACVAFVVCASMVFGMLCLGAGTGTVRASPDDAVFKGNVKIGTDPAPDTLVMYSMDVDSTPAGNSTVTGVAGDYELWVDGGHTYYMFYANGGAMFDVRAQLQSTILVGQTKWLNATLTPAPARTVTLKGYLTNASNASEPVTTGHVLGLRALMGGEPDYVNWTTPNSTGYFEVMVLPGMVMVAVFDAPGYFPSMGPMIPLIASPGDSLWLNLSLRPFTGYTVNVTGTVMDSVGPIPIQGAAVSANMEGMGFSASNTTDALGQYKVQFVDGYGNMVVSAAGYVSQQRDVLFSGNMSIDYTLNKVDAKVYGTVVDAYTGLPIPNATVWAESWLSPELRQFNETTAGPDGSYNLSLCGGDWRIGARALGYGESSVGVTILPSDSLLHNISLTPESGVIKGFVTDSATGLPIADTSVVVNGMSRSNSTVTNGTGFYAINCMPSEYQVYFMAVGYMWAMSINPEVVGPNETLWLNVSLDPATVSVSGTVTDAVTGSPITGASIAIMSLSPSDPDFVRMVMVTSVAGNYSAMVAHDDSFTVISADSSGYESFEGLTSIPDVADFWFNISMIPFGAPTFTIQGIVTDSSSGLPIGGASVDATFGMGYLTGTSTNSTGYYSVSVPTVNLTIRASTAGYLQSEVLVPAGAAGSVVWQNVSLDSHSEPPVVTNVTVAPNASVSVHNHANISVEIAEPYLTAVMLNFAQVKETIGDTAWIELGEGYYAMSMYGQFFGQLKWQEPSPGNWRFYMPDWDTTSSNSVMLTDATGVHVMSDSYGTMFDGRWTVWGQYSNSSLTFNVSANAVFDADGNFLGIDSGGGIEPGSASDETGMFWMEANLLQLNLTTGTIMSSIWGETDHLEAHTMHLDVPSIAYPSGEYAVIFSAVDSANNRNYSFTLFGIDNDAPVADAGENQTEIEGVEVMLNATLSTDNVGIVDYEWSFVDGATYSMHGAVLNYSFTVVGNHTVTLTVTDAAGYSTETSIWVNVLADQVPVAVAGPDQSVNEDTVVAFNGTGSHDDLGITNYTWTVVESTTAIYGAEPNFTFSTPGTYHVRLVVTDTAGHSSAYDEVVITVADTTPPVANAGPDQTVNFGTVASFDGSGSSDNAGVTQYNWTFIDGTAQITLTGVHPTYTFDKGGDYTVTLTVRDAKGNSDTDTMVIHVNAGPVANAGANIEISAGKAVTFDGSESTDDVQVVNYTWTFTYQGTVHKLYGMAPKFTFDEAGTYDIELTVKDGSGLTNTDTVTVTVTGKGAGASFVSQYWWVLLAVVVIAAAIVVAALLMRKGKGPASTPTAPSTQGEVPPPPTDSDELEFPPPSDEEL